MSTLIHIVFLKYFPWFINASTLQFLIFYIVLIPKYKKCITNLHQLTRWEHEIKVVTYILIYIRKRVFITSIINVDAIIVVIICVDVVVDVQHERDNRCYKTHITQSIGTACHSKTRRFSIALFLRRFFL